MRDFFSYGSPFLNHPLLTEERTRRETDFLVGSLALKPGARVLDVGCGFGRHCIELGRRGYAGLGIDRSGAMIEAARKQAAEAGVEVAFQQAAGEALPSVRKFDAAICLFTTLGQVAGDTDEDNRGLLAAVAGSLKVGGRFALELPQREAALDALREADRFGDASNYTQVQRRYETETGIVTERFELVSAAGAQAYRLRYRLFSREEVADLLTAAGLRIVNIFAGYSRVALRARSPQMLFVCAR